MFEFLGGDVGEFLLYMSVCISRGKERYGIEIRHVAFRFKDGFERWGDFLLEKGVPLYSIKKWMCFQFSCIVFCSESVFGVPIKKLYVS